MKHLRLGVVMDDHYRDNPSFPRPGEHVLLIGGPKDGWVYVWPEPYYGRVTGVMGDYEVVNQEPSGRWIAHWRGVRVVSPNTPKATP